MSLLSPYVLLFLIFIAGLICNLYSALFVPSFIFSMVKSFVKTGMNVAVMAHRGQIKRAGLRVRARAAQQGAVG